MSLFNKINLEQSLQSIQDYFAGELKKMQMGKANVDAISSVAVEAYGSTTNIQSVGQIIVEDGVTLKIVVWDKSILQSVDKALRNANLGAAVSVDSDSIRLKYLPVTLEDRQRKVKELNSMLEETRVKVRHTRQDYMKKLDSLTGVSEDEVDRDKILVQKIVDGYIKQIEELAKKKESDLTSL